jgi:hypothetical protein
MPSAADGRKDTGIGRGSDCGSDIAYIDAACDEAWCLSDHAIPDRSRILIAEIGGAQKVALELISKRGVDLQACPTLFMIALLAVGRAWHNFGNENYSGILLTRSRE